MTGLTADEEALSSNLACTIYCEEMVGWGRFWSLSASNRYATSVHLQHVLLCSHRICLSPHRFVTSRRHALLESDPRVDVLTSVVIGI